MPTIYPAGSPSSHSPNSQGKLGPMSIGKMPGHWALASAGKRVLRPGGLELTNRMLHALRITSEDRVVEFAPGLGVTARIVLERAPSSYCGVEREPKIAEHLQQLFASSSVRFVCGEAQKSGFPDDCASVVYGEAMLSMQGPEQKDRIFAEARRLLGAGGRYGIHELCFPDDTSPSLRHEIQAELSKEIHVGVQILTRTEWAAIFARNGMTITWNAEAPMHLLEPWRVLGDEGFIGGLRIVVNMLTKPMVRHRILAIRRLFRRYEKHLGAIAIVGTVSEN